jgi:hypothetical protein
LLLLSVLRLDGLDHLQQQDSAQKAAGVSHIKAQSHTHILYTSPHAQAAALAVGSGCEVRQVLQVMPNLVDTSSVTLRLKAAACH